MKKTLLAVILSGVLVALILTLASLIGSPRLQEVWPSDGANGVPAGASLRMSFSRPMQVDSLVQRLTIQPAMPGAFAWQENSLIFTPSRPWPSGQTIRVTLDAGARTAGGLSFSMRQGKNWSFTIGQPRLAYLYPNDSQGNIYVLDPLTAESSRWTDSAGGVQDFDVASNGAAIFYSVRSGQGGSAIYRLDLESVGLSEVVKQELPPPELVLECLRASCRSVTVSPRGDFLAYERAAFVGGSEPTYTRVWLLPLGGRDQAGDNPQPVLAGDALHQTIGPDWSPEGLLAFYDSNAAAYIILEPSSGNTTQFPNQTGQPGAWHPNGRDFVAPEIYFLDEGASEELTDLQALANSHLILFNRQDGATLDLTQFEELEDMAPVFSPDGAYLAFARKNLQVEQWTPGRQLWLMRTGTWQAISLTDEPLYSHFEFAWSPEGELLAYVRFNQTLLTEPPELWVIDPSTARAAQVVIGGYAPQWIP